MASQRALILLAVAAVVAAAATGGAGVSRILRDAAYAPPAALDRWLNIIEEYSRSGRAQGVPALQPLTLHLKTTLPGGGEEALPVLILPLPVSGQCPASRPVPAPHSAEYTRAPAPAPASKRPRPFQAPVQQPTADPEPVSSERLVELFRQQRALAPHLPPAVLGADHDVRFGDNDDNGYYSAPAVSNFQSTGDQYLPPKGGCPTSPKTPIFPQTLVLRGRLSVPHADYTEDYTVHWDAARGVGRLRFYDDGTTVYQQSLRGGYQRRVEVRTDRTGPRDVVRCAMGPQQYIDVRTPPALPEPGQFTFSGCEDGGRAERWSRLVAGGDGEMGAARGERLTYNHQLVVHRNAAGNAMPMRYSVTVDSSVLGPACESYEHTYLEAREQALEYDVYDFNPERQCEETEQLDETNLDHMARLDPLREFTLPARDPRYDEGLQRFKRQFERNYIDNTEEAVRKTLFVQHSRFVNAGNRLDATFELETNFLCDRLDVELDVLLGVVYDSGAAAADAAAEPFPYSETRIQTIANKLPREFDWRPRGAVTPVKYQGSCSSCWAFAVTGSVEGALFVRTRNLVELAEQCLVDCAHSHGAHGCNGTWPSHAYEYIHDRGLPARAEYTPYSEKVLRCRDREVPPVTHISGHVNVKPRDERALKVAIRRHAPSVVVVDARPKSFMFYKKGVLKDERCIKDPKQRLNHAVLAVGWGEQRGETNFILKNTYSAKWGDGGYIRLHAPSNTCGVLTFPSYAQLRRTDVDRPAATGGEDYPDDK